MEGSVPQHSASPYNRLLVSSVGMEHHVWVVSIMVKPHALNVSDSGSTPEQPTTGSSKNTLPAPRILMKGATSKSRYRENMSAKQSAHSQVLKAGSETLNLVQVGSIPALGARLVCGLNTDYSPVV